MQLHGKGQELRDDLTSMLGDKTLGGYDVFKTKWGQVLTDLLFDNFIHPLVSNIKDTEKAKHIVGKLDLFCAAFVNQI